MQIGFRAPLGALLFTLLAGSLAGASCSSVDPDTTGTTGTPELEPLGPGEVCSTPSPGQVKVRVEPSFVALPKCGSGACLTRTVNVVVDPDFCSAVGVTFESSDETIVARPADGSVTLHRPSIPLSIVGGKTTGAATITVRVPKGDGTDATATLDVDVLDPVVPACSGTAQGSLQAGGSLQGEGGLKGASLSLPAGADSPNQGSFLWSVPAFAANLACGADLAMPGSIALGPAITFGPETTVLPREIPMSIPINPALLPEKARWRHVKVVYSGPAFKAPRTVAVADPRVEKLDGQWVLSFKAPRLGTYQAVVRSDAGTKSRKRRITHRAVIGISMGGGGTATFGMRHHHLFDVLAPLGGPVDWTWLLHYIENNHLGGFRPIAPGTQLADIPLTKAPCATAAECAPDETCLGVVGTSPGKCTLLGAPTDPYEHRQTFNNWWAEFPRTGTGGRFPRAEYAQIFRDLALMYGNPNGENLTAGGENLPAGVHPDDPSQIGDHLNGECKVWVDPIDGPDKEQQQAIADSCPAERCANTLTLQNYYDDEYNPDGVFPVITVCDGTEQDESLTPYANTWKPEGNNYPLEVGLAVDYNGNGVRDELEPIIRAGHERWDDHGIDGAPSALEPGYAPGVNDDPSGDDYNAQYNPTGTEGDHRRQPEEAFDDSGLDGVMGTLQQPSYPVGYQAPGDGYDVGESDGEFTVARGLQRFWDRDAHSIVRGTTDSVPGGELTDAALSRIDLWTDGGTRDLFNFGVDAQHLMGAFSARGRDVAYFSDFTHAPGLDPSKPGEFVPARVVYEDLQGIVMQRYGKVDPSPTDIENGSGQHVGTANEIASRLQAALYFIGSRWSAPHLHTLVHESAEDAAPNATQCEIIGNCTFEFTSTFGRTGPVGVTLPPGYAHAAQQGQRYPVIFMLHGYGQTPEDLEAAIVFLRNWMNSPTDSVASRLSKAILVYVDGRCRVGEKGAECIRGSFFADSVRDSGVQTESWWLELMDYIDQNYRTLGETEVDWVD